MSETSQYFNKTAASYIICHLVSVQGTNSLISFPTELQSFAPIYKVSDRTHANSTLLSNSSCNVFFKYRKPTAKRRLRCVCYRIASLFEVKFYTDCSRCQGLTNIGVLRNITLLGITVRNKNLKKYCLVSLRGEKVAILNRRLGLQQNVCSKQYIDSSSALREIYREYLVKQPNLYQCGIL